MVHKDNEEKRQYDLADEIVSKSFSSTFCDFDDLVSEPDMLSNIHR